MNKIRILIVGLAAISAACLVTAGNASPPREVPRNEKVYALDNIDPSLFNLEIASCDYVALKAVAETEREAANYAVLQTSVGGRSGSTYAKVSAHGRTCRRVAVACSFRSKPRIEHEQRM